MSRSLQEWIGKPLDGFKIEVCYKAYRVGVDGKRVENSGVYFKDPDLVKVCLDRLMYPTYPHRYQVREILVLTNGYYHVLLGGNNILFEDVNLRSLKKVLVKDE